ncbi:hypothetical protein SLA2020_203350 [Shorea laevis]
MMMTICSRSLTIFLCADLGWTKLKFDEPNPRILDEGLNQTWAKASALSYDVRSLMLTPVESNYMITLGDHHDSVIWIMEAQHFE